MCDRVIVPVFMSISDELMQVLYHIIAIWALKMLRIWQPAAFCRSKYPWGRAVSPDETAIRFDLKISFWRPITILVA
jgi:hypothetical protein